MLTAWLVVLIALVGVLTFALAANPKVSRIGEILFFTGTLVTLFLLAGRTVKLG